MASERPPHPRILEALSRPRKEPERNTYRMAYPKDDSSFPDFSESPKRERPLPPKTQKPLEHYLKRAEEKVNLDPMTRDTISYIATHPFSARKDIRDDLGYESLHGSFSRNLNELVKQGIVSAKIRNERKVFCLD